MTKNENKETLQQVQIILRNQFKDSTLQVDLDTQAKDITGWDSLKNIKIFIDLEQKFKIKFSGTEILDLENIADIIKLIINKKFNN